MVTENTGNGRIISLALGRFDLVIKLIHGNIMVRIDAKPLTSTLALQMQTGNREKCLYTKQRTTIIPKLLNLKQMFSYTHLIL